MHPATPAVTGHSTRATPTISPAPSPPALATDGVSRSPTPGAAPSPTVAPGPGRWRAAVHGQDPGMNLGPMPGPDPGLNLGPMPRLGPGLNLGPMPRLGPGLNLGPMPRLDPGLNLGPMPRLDPVHDPGRTTPVTAGPLPSRCYLAVLAITPGRRRRTSRPPRSGIWSRPGITRASSLGAGARPRSATRITPCPMTRAERLACAISLRCAAAITAPSRPAAGH